MWRRTSSSRHFLLCLDEYQRLEEVIAATGSRAILNFLRDMTGTPRTVVATTGRVDTGGGTGAVLERLSDQRAAVTDQLPGGG